MLSKKRLGLFAGMVGVLIVGAMVGSRLPVFAQAGRIGGAYRVIAETNQGPVEFGAMFTSEGGVVGSVATLACLLPDTSISVVFGSWTLRPGLGGAQMHYQLVGPIYQNGQSIGELRMVGSNKIPIGTEVHGRGVLDIPEASGCSNLSGDFQYTAEEVPPLPPRRLD